MQITKVDKLAFLNELSQVFGLEVKIRRSDSEPYLYKNDSKGCHHVFSYRMNAGNGDWKNRTYCLIHFVRPTGFGRDGYRTFATFDVNEDNFCDKVKKHLSTHAAA